MKNEIFCVKDYQCKTYDELKQEIEKYITFYNNERIKLALKASAPIQDKKTNDTNKFIRKNFGVYRGFARFFL